MNRFNETSFVITGGGSGIGAATARRFAEEGGDGLLVDLDPSVAGVAEAIAGDTGREIRSVVADVTTEKGLEAIRATVEPGSWDILVNSAGIGDRKPFDHSDAETWQRVFDINLKSVFLVSQAVAPHLRPGGSIVNIGSLAGLRIRKTGVAYSSLKAAIHHLTRSMAIALAPEIRVNAVAPGPIRTELSRERWSTPEGVAVLLRGVLTQRLGEPEDVAEAIAYLASPGARFVTGAILAIDGGASISGFED